MFRRLPKSLVPKKAPDPEAFTSELAGHFQKSAPKSEVNQIGVLELEVKTAGGSTHTVNLHNLFQSCTQDPANRSASISRFVRALAHAASGPTILPRSVVPVIRTCEIVAELNQSIVARMKKDLLLATEEIGAHLVIMYVCDSPDTVQYLSTEDVAGMHLGGENLRELAVGNLRRILTDVKSEGGAGLFLFQAGNCYEPSLILFNHIWEKLRAHVRGDFLFGIPARGVLFVADSAVPAAVAHLSQAIQDIYAQESYRLSDKIYVRHGDRITFYAPDQRSLES